MFNAIGGGLIGWGAILLASTLVFPTARSSVAEFDRTGRNTRAATALSIISTAFGAVVILANHEWKYALAGLGLGAAVYYLVQVTLTYRAWRALAAQVALEREDLRRLHHDRNRGSNRFLDDRRQRPAGIPHAGD